MGLIYAELTLSNPRKPELKSIKVKALAGTGAFQMCLPQELKEQLELEVIDERPVTLADGGVKKVPYAGPLMVDFEGRSSFCGALIIGDEPLLGAIPVEDMDIVLNPLRQQIEANPAHPNVPHYKIK